MPIVNINQLSASAQVLPSDQLATYSNNDGYTKKMALSVLRDWILSSSAAISVPQFFVQYFSPAATAFEVALSEQTKSTHLLITPLDPNYTGTITLPVKSNLFDQQQLLVTTTQPISSLTLVAPDSQILGAAASLAIYGFFTMKYDQTMNTWLRVG